MKVLKGKDCGAVVELLMDCEDTTCLANFNEVRVGTVDAALEKHVPVVEKVAGGIKVSVGSVAHPMEEKHYIEWIEVIADGKAYRQFLAPGQAPEAVFPIEAASITAREYCNLHGLWKL